MLKYIIFLFSLLVSFSNGFSQDLLIKSNGDTISISVVEIKGKYLIYKKIGQGDRIFTTAKNKLKKIMYANGDVIELEEYEETENNNLLTLKRGFFAPHVYFKEQKLKSKELIQLYEDSGNKRSLKLFKLGRGRNIAGNLLGLPSGFFLGQQLSNMLILNQDVNGTILWASSIASIISIALNTIGRKNIKESVRNFNNDLSITIGSTNNGIGMQLNF